MDVRKLCHAEHRCKSARCSHTCEKILNGFRRPALFIVWKKKLLPAPDAVCPENKSG